MFETIFLITTATMLAMVSGLFFGYSVSVTGALGQLKDIEYARAMQRINRVIKKNPFFMVIFSGLVILLPLVTFMYGSNMGSTSFNLLLGASILYIVGQFGVTIFGSEPLNNRLDALPIDSASSQELAEVRNWHMTPWNRLNLVRTYSGVLATALVFLAFFLKV